MRTHLGSRGIPPGDFLDAKALAIEAKLSWVEASTLSNPQEDIVTEAVIPVFDQSSASSILAQTSAAIGPSDILRQKAWGSAANGQPNQEDATAADANTQVISLNSDVTDLLTAAGAVDDPRINYWLIGATWTWRGAAPNGRYPLNPASFNEIGTSTLSNSTMETFQQGADPTFQTGSNCFTCHRDYTLTTPQSSVAVSHIFAGLDPL